MKSYLVKSLLVSIMLLMSFFAKAQTSAGTINMSNGTTNVESGRFFTFYDSGGDSGNYNNREELTRTFTAENGQPLIVTFNAFALQNSNNTDYLRIYDGPNTSSPLIGTYRRNGSPGTIITTGNSITFYFFSNNTNTATGWDATITSMDLSLPDITTCSASFTGGTENNKYYKVTYRSAEVGKSIRFDFTSFNLGAGDELIAIDGDSLTGPVIGSFTGNSSPNLLISENEALTFIYKGNNTDVGSGWSANVSCYAIANYYSYQNGSWNDPDTWTLDPSGRIKVNPGNTYPQILDRAVIINGNTVTVDNTNNTVTLLDIRTGGILDVQGATGQDYGSIMGKGRLRSSRATLPNGDYYLFTQSGGGTIELYGNTTASPNLSVTTFNNLEIKSTNNVNFVNTTQINGDLKIFSGALNINSPGGSSVTVEGNITVSSGAVFGMGNTGTNQRELIVKGNFENEGTVTFSSNAAADYTADPTRGVTLVFNNPAQNQSFVVNGVTTLDRLIVDKGTDDTYVLDVNASNTTNFRLNGRNNLDATFSDPGTILNNKALEVYAGTLKLGSNISIPRLQTAAAGSDFSYVIDQDAALILDGSSVHVTDVTGNNTNIIVYGKLKVIGNSSFSSNGGGGIILREYGVVELHGNATIETKHFRTSSQTINGEHRGSLIMSGGTFNVSGSTSYATTHPAFALPFPQNTLQLSGGTINITSQRQEQWLVSSSPENVSITGGTVNISASGINTRVNSSAPFYNLNLNNPNQTISIEPVTEKQQASTVTVPAAPRRPLVVLNNLTIAANTTFNPQNENVTVGRHFTLTGTYAPGTNTPTFNAFGIQAFTNSGTINGGG
ncbi:MAG: CUB domain-containing protein, partial [Tenuifilaceae bacterium]|nr:CUB domain-containing protein [Tenuifilaceae bacterium]